MGMEADAMMQVDGLIKKCGEINSSSVKTHFAIRRNKRTVVFRPEAAITALSTCQKSIQIPPASCAPALLPWPAPGLQNSRFPALHGPSRSPDPGYPLLSPPRLLRTH